ncbi:MAG: type II secretion system F family protein [Candidatus Omnitrophica bacterium]|nr:type II secretion system F family protein [Candidatus Omnitrophota bacterium]
MSIFTYSVRDQIGQLIKGSSEAKTKEELIRSLQVKGLTVISMAEGLKGTKRAKTRRKVHKKVNLDDLTLFARQLAVLLESGVTILRAITVLTQQIESELLLEACEKVEIDLKTGVSLRDAIAEHPKVFSQMWLDLIETGEATGQLAFVLRELADYLEEMRALRKKIISALIYPAVLIVVSVFAIFIFMYKVIPIFSGIYKGLGEMPALTRAVIGFSDFLTNHILKVIILAAILGFALRKYVKTQNGRKQFDRFKLKIPIVGDIIQSVAIERFARSLGMLLKGGISIIHALDIAIKSTANRVMEESLEKVKISVMEGKPISVPLAQMGIFPPLVSQMIAVGEESGKLAQLLDEVSKFYAEDISTKVSRLVTLFEPALLVIMGLAIGTLVVAMYMPIFKMATSFGGG